MEAREPLSLDRMVSGDAPPSNTHTNTLTQQDRANILKIFCFIHSEFIVRDFVLFGFFLAMSKVNMQLNCKLNQSSIKSSKPY